MRGSLLEIAVALLPAACGGSQPDRTAEQPTADRACLMHAREKTMHGAQFQPTPARRTVTPLAPIEIPRAAIEGKRIFGRTLIVPDEDTRRAIHIVGVTRTCPWFRLCLDTSGVPTHVDVLRTSCFPRYDAQIVEAMLEWRYSPFTIDGNPVAVCTSLVVCYSQP